VKEKKRATPPPRIEHFLKRLAGPGASCSCGAEFTISAAAAAPLSPARIQDALLDLYHDHREDVNREQI
jgi:hypothetical protein